MNSPIFHKASFPRDREQLVAINTKYLTWVWDEMQRIHGISAELALGANIHSYIEDRIGDVFEQIPECGVFYLVQIDGEVVGMGGLRRIGENVAELKRMYVLPEFRRMGLGSTILSLLIEDSRTFGYHQIRLGTALFMTDAQELYIRYGFTDCEPYAEAEEPRSIHPHWRFLELMIS